MGASGFERSTVPWRPVSHRSDSHISDSHIKDELRWKSRYPLGSSYQSSVEFHESRFAHHGTQYGRG